MFKRHLKVAFKQTGARSAPGASQHPPKLTQGSPEILNLTKHMQYIMRVERNPSRPPNHANTPKQTRPDFSVKTLTFSKMKGKEEEGQGRDIWGKI